MPKDPDAFFAAIEQGELPPVVALGGAERVYVDDALATLRRRALEGAIADFNHDRVSARERTMAEVVAMARTLPVMARRRLVEVRDAGSIREAELEALGEYLDAPSPESVLALVFDDIDLRDKLVKRVDKAAMLCRFDHPKERDMPAHVARRARRHALKLDRDATEALAATVGADLTLLERALEKLALVADDGAINAGHVERHVADTHLEDAFAFARAVAKAERGAALASLAALQAAREEPLRIVGLLAWQLRQIARARALLDEGRSPQDVGRELNLYGDRMSAVMTAARRLEMRGHSGRLSRLAAADQLLKGSRQPPWLVMTRLVMDLCPLPSPAKGSSAAGARAGAAAPARAR
jgi:DNA polymerase III subunit delta